MQMPRNDPTSREPGIVESPTRARQAVTGHNVRYVLIFGLAGVIVAFVIIYVLFFAR